MFKKLLYILLLIVITLSFVSCASKYMKPAEPDAIMKYKPAANEAVVIFMRPSTLGFAIQSSVFDVTTEENVFVGIVASKAKVAYKTTSGEHLFMVVGESSDFMRAELEGGKTYYALVTPRMGMWKARFSLEPIHKIDLQSSDFKDWESSCNFTENTDASYQWAKDNATSLQSKRLSYYKKWINKSEGERPLLKKEDGI